jgi:hypothetical protein
MTLLNETLPNDIVKSKIYYHGTSNLDNALNIIKNGINPPEIVTNKNMAPIKGKIYITENLKYAIIYALNGDFIGSKHLQVDYNENKKIFDRIISDNPSNKNYGQFGFVFIIKGSELLDVTPDEDSIGCLLSFYLNDRGYNSDLINYDLVKNDYNLKSEILNLANKHISPNTLKKVKDGDYNYWAKTGKILVKRLSDNAKLKIINAEAHIAHEGTVQPFKMLKIDKTKVGFINKDLSNLKDYSTVINL